MGPDLSAYVSITVLLLICGSVPVIAQGPRAALYGSDVAPKVPWTAPSHVPWKNVRWSVLPTDAEHTAIFDSDGRLTTAGNYYYRLATEPQWLERHLAYAFGDPFWRFEETPTFKGWTTANQSVLHRAFASLKTFVDCARSSPEVDPSFKNRLMTAEWRVACERVLRKSIGPRGLLRSGEREFPMAQAFHLLRSTLEDGRHPGNFMREEEVWTLPEAQKLVRSILTDSDIICPEDLWLAATPAYLNRLRSASKIASGDDGTKGNVSPDDDGSILSRDRSVFYTGGLFIGWQTTHPSLHATWDALAIINILYSHYPQPDPTKPDSIFHTWFTQSASDRERGIKAMSRLSRRLWLDYAEQGGPTWCRVVAHRPTESVDRPSQAMQMSDHAGYSIKDRTHWAYLAWQEMFGRPDGPSCDGVQVLVAVCENRAWNPADRRWPQPAVPGAAGDR